MIIGFTGRRDGMTEEQVNSVREILKDYNDFIWSDQEPCGMHGDCIGADEDFDKLCWEQHINTKIRPCTYENLRAFTNRSKSRSHVLAEPKPPMQRNRDIVADADVMIACPPNYVKIKRGSGTWAPLDSHERQRSLYTSCSQVVRYRRRMSVDKRKCNACGEVDEVYVSGGYGPMSIARCKPCIEKQKMPWWNLVAYISCAGDSPECINDAFNEEVEFQCNLHNKTVDEFWAECKEEVAKMNKYFEGQEAKEEKRNV